MAGSEAAFGLRDVVERIDQVPDDVVRQARLAFATRARDSSLLELEYDSLIDADILVRREAGAVRVLTFKGFGVSVMVRVVPFNHGVRLIGRAPGLNHVRVECRSSNAFRDVTTDRDGQFIADDIPSGPARLHLRGSNAGGEPKFHTDWVNL